MGEYSSLASMANTADYSAMNYEGLVELNLAFTWALGNIKPLIEVKRHEEMLTLTRKYVTLMNAYGATKVDALNTLEEAYTTGDSSPEPPGGVDDQTECAVTETVAEENHTEFPIGIPAPVVSIDGDEDVMAHMKSLIAAANNCTDGADNSDSPATPESDVVLELPAPKVSVISEETIESSNASDTQVEDSSENEDTNKEENLVEKAIEMAKSCGVPKNIDKRYPYYVDYTFYADGNGSLRCSAWSGKNVSVDTIKEVKKEDERYVKLDCMFSNVMSTDEYIAAENTSGEVNVTLYHIPAKGKDYKFHIIMTDEIADVCENTAKNRRVIKKGLVDMEKFLDMSESDKSFCELSRFTFVNSERSMIGQQGISRRVFVNPDMLLELKDAFEKHANPRMKKALVVKTERSVAYYDYLNGSSNIFVFTIHPPVACAKDETSKECVEHPISNGQTASESKEIVEVSSNMSESNVRDIILNGVEMSKTLPVADGTDTNSAYFVQHEFTISNGGDVVYSGKTFSQNVKGEDIDSLRKKHVKYARVMKASAIVSNDSYTACITNGGKTLSVYAYNAK